MEQRSGLKLIFEQSPSLQHFAKQDLPKVYRIAVKRASLGTGIPPNQFPTTCPFSFERVIDDDVIPE